VPGTLADVRLTEKCFSRMAQIVVRGMRRLTWLILPAIGLVLAAGQSAPHDAIAGLGPIGPVTVVHGGFTFTEEPAADRNGNASATAQGWSVGMQKPDLTFGAALGGRSTGRKPRPILQTSSKTACRHYH
jgi:hypothetical protein